MSSNSFEKVRREVKLGFNFGTKRVPLRNVRQKGGQIQLTDFIVSHIVSVKKERTGEIFHEEMLIQQDQEDYFDVRMRIIDCKDLLTLPLIPKDNGEAEDAASEDMKSVKSNKSSDQPASKKGNFCFELVLFKVTWSMVKQISTGSRMIVSNLEVHKDFEYGILDSLTPDPNEAFQLCKKYFSINVKKNQDFAMCNNFDS